MTLKQFRFVREYLIDLNATQAAIRAGYSERAARQTGHKPSFSAWQTAWQDVRVADRVAPSGPRPTRSTRVTVRLAAKHAMLRTGGDRPGYHTIIRYLAAYW